jgi:PAS domain S-box-containing protein
VRLGDDGVPAASTTAPPPAVRAVQAALVAAVAVHGVSTVPGLRGDPLFHTWLDGWVQGGLYVLTAVLATLRVVLVRQGRSVWGWVAAALTLRAAGFVVWLGYLRTLEHPPYPSVADAAWLAMPVVLGVGLVNLVVRRTTGLTLTLVLDGVVGALATLALGIALLWSTLQALAPAGIPTRVLLTNLAYPALDLALLVVVLGVLVAHAWRPPQELWWLAAGVAGFAVVDSVFVYLSAQGRFHPGLWIAGLSDVATAVIAWSAWIPSRPVGESRVHRMPGLVLPTSFAVVGIALLGYASTADVTRVAVLLAMAALLVAVVRTALTFHDVADLAEARRAAAASGRLAAVVRASQEAICTIDTAGVVTSWNPAAERLYGVPAAAAVGRPLRQLGVGSDAGVPGSSYELVVGGAIGGRHSQAVDVDREAPDGTSAVHQWSADPVRDDEGDVVGAAFMIKDVTAERAAAAAAAELRERVQHARRLESLGHLAGGVAHDFNNLLGALTLTAETQQRHLAADHPARADSDQVLRIARRAGALVRQLLVFSRRESAHVETLDLGALVRQVDDLLERTLGEHIDRRLDLDTVACPVEGDPARAGRAQPRHQRPGRHAARRHAGAAHPTGRPRLEGRGARPAGAGAAVRAALGRRQRPGHGQRHPGARLRAVLHHQAAGQRHRARPGRGLRRRPVRRRRGLDRVRAGPWDVGPRAAAGGRGPAADRTGRAADGAARATPHRHHRPGRGRGRPARRRPARAP